MKFIPETYDDWKHCITVSCGIPLTPQYVQERIVALTDPKDHHTQRFIERWGQDHHTRTLAWFHKAAEELQGQPSQAAV